MMHAIGYYESRQAQVTESVPLIFILINRLLQKNACVYWLPCALKCAPESLRYLLQYLRGAYEKQVTAVDSIEMTTCFSAYLSVLKVGRSLAFLQTKDLVSAFVVNHIQTAMNLRTTITSVVYLLVMDSRNDVCFVKESRNLML